ncbi:uncharacterized protein LOC125441300 [Sphaerodactylus townsendi]|uniref:uncharacterized protein LOC125441300 n=1 Tax=Sphaerodactylus townsendi TaxID=933632 RepID=UPI0020263D64|nr:uncharacterized protein LOC125441300 [Sphaerodactylus townsendi]
MLPSIHSGIYSKCTFNSKGHFTTNLELALARNQVHASQQTRLPTSQREFWTKEPLDFSYKLYITPGIVRKPVGKSKKDPKKREKTTTNTLCEDLQRITSRWILPVIEQQKPPKIITKFPHIGPYEAQLMFVKKGKFKSGKYQDPKPYDFRQFETSIPDFVTSYARDPLNLKFKTQHLSTVYGLQPLKEEKRGSKGRFITHKPRELKWDSKLILPKEPWPARPCSFTRHKDQRRAHSAFIERVEEVLSKLWQQKAKQKQKESRKLEANAGQKRPSTVVSIEGDSATKLEEKIHKESLQNEILPMLPSTGACSWMRPAQTRLVTHIKSQPLGYLLPAGIVQSVEELRCKL